MMNIIFFSPGNLDGGLEVSDEDQDVEERHSDDPLYRGGHLRSCQHERENLSAMWILLSIYSVSSAKVLSFLIPNES